MDGIDRYVLGLAVLEGDRDARKILADLLEEQGDRGLADWARRCKGKSNRRLDLAIMLLPIHLALRLGASYAEAAEFDCQGRKLRVCKDVSECVKNWYLKVTSDNDLLGICQMATKRETTNMYALLQRGSPRSRAAYDTAQATAKALVSAVDFAVQSFQIGTDDPRLVPHREGLAKQQIREVAMLTRNWNTPATAQPANQHATAVDWQIDIARAVFNFLIAPEERPWPQ